MDPDIGPHCPTVAAGTRLTKVPARSSHPRRPLGRGGGGGSRGGRLLGPAGPSRQPRLRQGRTSGREKVVNSAAGRSGIAHDRSRVLTPIQLGRASCWERVCQYVLISVVAVSLKKKKEK